MLTEGAQHKGSPELFFGIVGPLGADTEGLRNALAAALRAFGYTPRTLKLSAMLSKLQGLNAELSNPNPPTDVYIKTRQDAGNELRRRTGIHAAMAVLGMHECRELRETQKGSANSPIPGTAYIIDSLKNKKEPDTLRAVYGPHFFLLAAFRPKEKRIQRLAERIARSHNTNKSENYDRDARDLIARDETENGDEFGQNVQDTFPKADAFFNTSDAFSLECEVKRFVNILFGSPSDTPTRDEFAMFQAQAAALRSCDPSRQVGAVIATADGEIIAVGANEVPKFGGGQYWPGDTPDVRDCASAEHTPHKMRDAAILEVVERLRENGELKAESEGGKPPPEMLSLLKGTELMGIGEFGRVVHAEMAALMSAARRGVSTQSATLYTTTFPCENCARHAIAAGISRVVFISPYPKSRALKLHADAIEIEGGSSIGKVSFQPFVGIAPRRYLELFTCDLESRKSWRINIYCGDGQVANPRGYDSWPLPAYFQVEVLHVDELLDKMQRESVNITVKDGSKEGPS